MKNLPDIQSTQISTQRETPLAWVGIEKVLLPLSKEGGLLSAVAECFAGVNLTNPTARGIHMSRLYKLLEDELPSRSWLSSPIDFFYIHDKLIKSQEGLATEAEWGINFSYSFNTKSLVTEIETLKVIPVSVKVKGSNLDQKLTLGFSFFYSSTCPQSYALSTQAMTESFDEVFLNEKLTSEAIKNWISKGLVATPHAQRSQAQIYFQWSKKEFEQWDGGSFLKSGWDNQFKNWVLHLEKSLGTPTQGLVKRQDEKSFAYLNAQNPLFCEDAARRLKSQIQSWDVPTYWGEVTHYESLHPFDVKARFSSL